MADEKAKPVVKPAPAVVSETDELEEVYQFTLEDGQVHAWHGSTADLKTTYPDAVITGQLKMDELGQGYFVAYVPAKSAPKSKAPAAEAPEPEKEIEI